MAKIPKPKYLLLNGNKMAKFMKSVFALGIIVLLFSFNSCSNSQYSDIEESIDNGSGSQGNKLAKQLIGTWKIKNNSATFSYFENGEGLYENRNSNGAIFWLILGLSSKKCPFAAMKKVIFFDVLSLHVLMLAYGDAANLIAALLLNCSILSEGTK